MDKFSSEDTLAGQRLAIEEYLQTIATGLQAGNVPALDLGLRVNQMSKIIGLDGKQINNELTRRLRRAERAASYNLPDKNATGDIDYGKGLFAAAQREVLEVLLNEPKLFETVSEKITADVFDVPILRQVAEILFERLQKDVDTTLREILAGAESVELGNCLMELAQAGEEKGNFQARLSGALSTIERYQAQKRNNQVTTADDQREYLRSICENKSRENPHNVGMV